MMIIFSLLFLIPTVFVYGSFWLSSYWILFLSIFSFFSLGQPMFYSNLFFNFGVDNLSVPFIYLSLWLSFLMILASSSIFSQKFYSEFFIFLVLILLISLIFVFSSLNLFYFYLSFEVSLIPTILLIFGFGVQPERLGAGVFLLFYTLLASLPMMISIFFVNKSGFSLEFFFIGLAENLKFSSFYLYLCMNLVFFVKIPLFTVHLWLPKAHVEAPISGSMVLAGIMLKLGGYGLLRMMIIFQSLVYFNFFFIMISLIGALVVSFLCFRQSDMKMLIAYSSISHMGLALGGLLTLSVWGVVGSIILMLAHGLCSSGLFCLANFAYERSGSRSFFLNRGLITFIPSLSLWWFLFCSSNMAAPPSLNLLGEIILISSVYLYSSNLSFILFFLVLLAAVYSLFLYSFSQHGKFYSGMHLFSMGLVREYILLFLHWVPLNVLFLKADFLVFWY